MADHVVIARAFRGKPLSRVVIEASRGRVYVANPALLEGVRNGDTYAVAFPSEDVFEFNEGIYERLTSEWEKTGATLPETWKQLKSLHA